MNMVHVLVNEIILPTQSQWNCEIWSLNRYPLVTIEEVSMKCACECALFKRGDACRNWSGELSRIRWESESWANELYWITPFCLGPPISPHQPICTLEQFSWWPSYYGERPVEPIGILDLHRLCLSALYSAQFSNKVLYNLPPGMAEWDCADGLIVEG